VLSPLPAAYRLAHGEADFLPGLVVDRYDDVLVVQALTAGMDRRQGLVASVLAELLAPRAIVARNDSPMRALEGLEEAVEVLQGHLDGPVLVSETPAHELPPLRLEIDVLTGQKTGAFLDQRANLEAAVGLAAGARILDLCCHDGFWSLAAGRAGARACLGLDASAPAIARARRNADANQLAGICTFQEEDLFDGLRRLQGAGARFEVVFLDPPAFIKRRARIAEGIKGYVTVNRRAMELIPPGGWLVASSCSHHLDREGFCAMLQTAAGQARRTLRFVELRGARADHPVLAAVPQTEYLKCAICQVL
jgi:23S rRNA (cytosine1962-C5)-methyltransferase